MMFKSIVLAAAIASASASFEQIKTFTPLTGVTDHAGISYDQTSIENLVVGKTQGSMDQAGLVYTQGGNSKSVATLTVTGGLPQTVKADTKLTAKGVDGRDVIGVANKDANANDLTIEFKYPVRDDQDNHLDCRVGGLPANERKTEGCLVASGSLNIDNVATPVSYTYAIETDNDNGRTIQGFSTDANTRMRPGDNTDADYFADFQKFFDYYGSYDYADKIVNAALQGNDANLANGDMLISQAGMGFDGRLEIVKKGTAYLSVAMYVIRELEDAIYDCDTKCTIGNCNDDSAVHALDEAVAFYYGADNNFHHDLANKRCINFGTCTGDNPTEGDAKVNAEIFDLFGQMQTFLQRGECDNARPLVSQISTLMWIPLIQGTLRYAWILDTDNNPGALVTEKAQAEGAIFAAAVLPIVHNCNAEHASTIYDNMKVQQNDNVDFPAVKRAFESCYGSIGIECSDIGGITNNAGTEYDAGATVPCGGFNNLNSSATSLAVGSVLGASILAAVAFLLPHMYMEKPLTMLVRVLLFAISVLLCRAFDIDKFTAPATICGYLPLTRITDYAVLDLDHEAIRHRLTLGQITKATNLYQMGGNAYPVAKLTLQAPRDAFSFPAGTKVYGVAKAHDRTVFGTLIEPVAWDENTQGNVTLEVAYFTSLFDKLPEENQCRVGGYYTFERANMNGCFTNDSGKVELVLSTKSQGHGELFPYVYDIRHDNVNYLTLQTLSTNDVAEHKACDDNDDCPYFDDFSKYLDYYGNPDFGNRWIMAASSFDTTQFANPHAGQANFGPAPKIAVAEAIIIGILEMNVLLKIMQSIEQASVQCQPGCSGTGHVLCNEPAIHYLDKSVAMYCGSIEGPNGTGEGVFQYALAQRRSIEFGVDNVPGQTTNGRIMKAFQNFQDLLLQGHCGATLQQRKQEILSLLKVPLVQSVLRFAYIREFVEPFDLEDEPKAEAFGATFAAALLPMVHNCHRSDANIIYENLRMGSETSAVSFRRVKEALEKNYECMGIRCEDIGGIWMENGFAEGAGPCDPSTLDSTSTKTTVTTTASSKPKIGVLSFLGVSLAAMVVMVMAFFIIRRRGARESQPVVGVVSSRRRLHVRRRIGSASGSGGGNIAAVSTIS